MRKLYNGKTIAQWAKETGIKAETLSYRLRSGMSIDQAIKLPVTQGGSASKTKHPVEDKIFTDRFGNQFVVGELDHRDHSSVAYYKVRFLKSGYETVAPSSQIRRTGHAGVFDRLSPSVFGVGVMGYAHQTNDPKIFDVWRAMIARCYNPKNPSYKTYGANGFTVCDRWKRFDYFLEDVRCIPGYNKDEIEAGRLVMDKDIRNREAKTYSIETCSFVSRSENTRESALRRWNKSKV